MARLWRQILATSGGQGYALVIGIAVLAITARWLGPDGRGAVVAATTWTTMVASWASLSLGQAALFLAANGKFASAERPPAGTVLALNLASALIAWGGLGTVWILTDGRAFGDVPTSLLLLAFSFLPFVVWEQSGATLLMLANRVSSFNAAVMIGRTVSLVLVAGGWALRAGAGVAVLSTFAASVATAIATFAAFRPGFQGERWFDARTARGLVSAGLRLHGNYAAEFLFSSLGVLVVNAHAGTAETGNYQVALLLASVLVVLPQAAGMVLAGHTGREGASAAWAAQRRVLGMLLLVMAAAVGVVYLLAPMLLPVLLGPSFAPAVPLFQVLALSAFGPTLSRVMAPQWVARGLFAWMAILTIVLGGLHALAVFLWVPTYGATGAAWALVLANTASAILHGVLALRCELEHRRILAAGRAPQSPGHP